MLIPDIETFLEWTNDQVAEFAPKTVVYAPAGTRRRAILEGIPVAEYSTWAIQELGESVPTLFEHGIRHVIVPSLGPHQLHDPQEEYRSQIIHWVANQSTSKILQTIAEKHQYRLMLIGPAIKNNKILFDASMELKNRKQNPKHPILWMYVVQSYDEPWREVLDTAIAHQVNDRGAIAQILYGEEISPVSLYIGFGRLNLHPRIIPLILFDDDVQCYWTTKAGFRISKMAVRKILYDSIYSRSRYNYHQTRYDFINELKNNWNKEVIMGLGSNMRGFWFPKTNLES